MKYKLSTLEDTRTICEVEIMKTGMKKTRLEAHLTNYCLIFKGFTILLIASVCGVALTTFCDTDGKPNCSKLGRFTNHWDPTRYWECTQLHQEPKVHYCDRQGYDPITQKCVSWEEWDSVECITPPEYN